MKPSALVNTCYLILRNGNKVPRLMANIHAQIELSCFTYRNKRSKSAFPNEIYIEEGIKYNRKVAKKIIGCELLDKN
jgi:hypothetical protein